MFERFDVPVRCSAGHLFTTIWVPLASVKAVRIGPARYQYCPVGHHWATVTQLIDDDTPASGAELSEATRVHDLRIP